MKTTEAITVVTLLYAWKSSAPPVLNCQPICPAGYHKDRDTSSLIYCQDGEIPCTPCEDNTYVDFPNTGFTCFPHTVCRSNEMEVKVGTASTDTKCICGKNLYKTPGGSCYPWTKCRKGYGVDRAGSSEVNVECQECVNGTFSDTEDSVSPCKAHTRCEDEGSEVKTPGSKESNTICKFETSSVSSLPTVASATSTLSITEEISKSNHSSFKNSSEEITTTKALVQEANGGNLIIMATVLGLVGGIIVFILLCIIFLCVVKRRPQSRPQGGIEEDRPCLANGQPMTENIANGLQSPTGHLNDHPHRIASVQPLQSTCRLSYYYPSTSNDANGQSAMSNHSNGQPTISNHANGQPPMSNLANDLPPMGNHANGQPPRNDHANGQPPMRDHANGQPPMRDHASGFPTSPHNVAYSQPVQNLNLSVNVNISGQMSNPPEINVSAKKDEDPTNGDNKDNHGRDEEDDSLPAKGMQETLSQPDHGAPTAGVPATESSTDHSAPSAGVPATESSSDHGAPTAGVPATESPTDNDTNSHAEGNPQVHKQCTDDPEGNIDDLYEKEAREPVSEIPLDDHNACDDQEQQSLPGKYEMVSLIPLSSPVDTGDPVSEQIENDEQEQERERLLGDCKMVSLDSD